MFNIRCASAVIFQLSLITYYVVSDSWTSLSYCQYGPALSVELRGFYRPKRSVYLVPVLSHNTQEYCSCVMDEAVIKLIRQSRRYYCCFPKGRWINWL